MYHASECSAETLSTSPMPPDKEEGILLPHGLGRPGLHTGAVASHMRTVKEASRRPLHSWLHLPRQPGDTGEEEQGL